MLLGDAKDTVSKLYSLITGSAAPAASSSSASSSSGGRPLSSIAGGVKTTANRSLTEEKALAAEAKYIEGVMTLGVVRETKPLEKRVAITPALVPELQKMGFSVLVERGAGVGAGYADDSYKANGARLASTKEVWSKAEVLVKFNAPRELESGKHEVEQLSGSMPQLIISFVSPAQNAELLTHLAKRNKKLTALAMDLVPRTTRAQKIDALSSQGGIAGYRAVIESARLYQRFFQGTITAAGKYPPAKFLILGAGVAGLAALGTAKGLGAEVRVFDTRAVCKEQTESMGGIFLTIDMVEEGQSSASSG